MAFPKFLGFLITTFYKVKRIVITLLVLLINDGNVKGAAQSPKANSVLKGQQQPRDPSLPQVAGPRMDRVSRPVAMSPTSIPDYLFLTGCSREHRRHIHLQCLNNIWIAAVQKDHSC